MNGKTRVLGAEDTEVYKQKGRRWQRSSRYSKEDRKDVPTHFSHYYSFSNPTFLFWKGNPPCFLMKLPISWRLFLEKRKSSKAWNLTSMWTGVHLITHNTYIGICNFVLCFLFEREVTASNCLKFQLDMWSNWTRLEGITKWSVQLCAVLSHWINWELK